jgi:hypothetical protein
MPQYYLYLLGQDGHIRAREIVTGSNDDEAASRARRYLSDHPKVPAVELWFAERRISKFTQPNDTIAIPKGPSPPQHPS